MFSGNTSSAANDAVYIEDVFSTYLYTGNGPSSQTITNGIDLAGKGGLVWAKARTSSVSLNHALLDTARGNRYQLFSDATNAQVDCGTTVTNQAISSFNSNGFTLGGDQIYGGTNYSSSATYVSWTFRKQPKFFDIVTYTGTGTSTRTLSHSLASTPACIIVKKTSTTSNWWVWHRSLSANTELRLNTTDAAQSSFNWGTPTSADFTVTNTFSGLNESGVTYVAYLFAHDAGGFGLTGTDNVVSCGSFTTDGSGNASVTLGYEPQWVLAKRTDVAENWFQRDIMRGMSYSQNNYLVPNASNAESGGSGSYFVPTATGFTTPTAGAFSASATYIYIAIRKGPMKVPTDATKVFSPITSSSTLDTVQTTGFPVDAQMVFWRTGSIGPRMVSRLQGVATTAINGGDYYLQTNLTDTEANGSNTRSWNNTGFVTPTSWQSVSMIYESFRRAPKFFDEVCYSGAGIGTTQNIAHNLTVAPEFMLVKLRNQGASSWWVYHSALGPTKGLILNDSGTPITNSSTWNDTAPTSSVFTVGALAAVNFLNTWNYVAYLFATCAGVSKVGSYTGTGTLTTINCGFTGGARFVLIKRTDTTGNWFVWDTARGMVAGTDPSFATNSSSAESNANSVYTATTGFQLLASPSADVNTNGGTYIYLAIA